jgi:hypothetical protein
VGLLAGGRRSPEGECAAVEPVRCNTLSRPRDLSRDGELRLAAAVGDDSESFPEDTDGGSGVMGPRRLRHRQVAGAHRAPSRDRLRAQTGAAVEVTPRRRLLRVRVQPSKLNLFLI